MTIVVQMRTLVHLGLGMHTSCRIELFCRTTTRLMIFKATPGVEKLDFFRSGKHSSANFNILYVTQLLSLSPLKTQLADNLFLVHFYKSGIK